MLKNLLKQKSYQKKYVFLLFLKIIQLAFNRFLCRTLDMKSNKERVLCTNTNSQWWNNNLDNLKCDLRKEYRNAKKCHKQHSQLNGKSSADSMNFFDTYHTLLTEYKKKFKSQGQIPGKNSQRKK